MRKRNTVTATRDRQRAGQRRDAPDRAETTRASRKTANGVRITHPERIVYPGTTITKQDVADYYRAVMPWLLPEIANRPLSVIRCPDGTGAACFFQKHHADKLGSAVGSIPIREKGGSTGKYLYVDD